MRRGGVTRWGGLVATIAVSLAAALGAAPASAHPVFTPRSGYAMGIEPRDGSQEIALGTNIPVVYHGGSVMRDVTVHTVFWAPAGYRFDGSPASGVPGYEALIQQFFADVARDSGSTSDIFSVLHQYGDQGGAGSEQLDYSPGADSVTDTTPYPDATKNGQCPSPSGVATCVTDLQIQRELDRLISTTAPSARGLSNLWFVLLPPDVDTCLSPGTCATTAYAGYHSSFQLGHGLTIYSPIPDPLVEFTPPPGSDPQGNPEGEVALDTVAHEAIEAITDPVGTAWMDPNGFETADKCETGPQQGAPMGYAGDGSPYNQLINGHEYLIQDIWSNTRNGCVQSSSSPGTAPALHTLDLRQFSASVSGSVGAPVRTPVAVLLGRAGQPVAEAHGLTRADGTWGPLVLRNRHGRPVAVGDDRDQLSVIYGFGPRSPAPDFVSTGSGGNPFTEAGFTGWFDLDNGAAVSRHGVTVGPCGQTGVLSLRVGRVLTASPTDLCETETDAAQVAGPRIGAGTAVSLTSLDNRGAYVLNPPGTLVRMSVTLGEPDSVSALGAAGPFGFVPSGFPTCTAFIRIRTVRCSGLVPHGHYTLTRRGARIARGAASGGGVLTEAGLTLSGGEAVSLVNSAGRRLSTLHVAHLRVNLIGAQTRVASGSCQPGDYWGGPVTHAPTSSAVGTGISGSGTICPASGRAAGLPTADIAQTDDFSGGQTVLQVPVVESTAPTQDETLYGSFFASAQSGLPGPHGTVVAGGVPVSLTIRPAGSRHSVFHRANVDTPRGVSVHALAAGAYVATWVLHDAAGDTRTLTTRFFEA